MFCYSSVKRCYEPLGYEFLLLSKIYHPCGWKFPSLGAHQKSQDLFLFSEALGKSKANFIGKVGWDTNFQNGDNSNQGYPVNHQNLINEMQKVAADLFVCAGS